MWLETASPDTDLTQLHTLWTKLATSTNQADPFCCAPPWQLAFHEAFSPGRRLFIEASAESLLTLAEEAFSPDDVFLTPFEASWLFGCPMLGDHAVELLTNAIGCFVSDYAPTFPKIVVSGIRPTGLLARRLLRRFVDGFDIFLQSSGAQCAASLEGGMDGYLSRRSANHRAKLKKAVKRASREGIGFERVAPISPHEAEQAYQRILAVEHLSWKGAGHCGIGESPAREFYGALLRRLAVIRGARIIFARHENTDIGFIFGGLAGDVYRGQQFSYAQRWKDWSVGNLMQVEKITWLCEEGVQRYDMGPLDGPRMQYKDHWTEEVMEIQTWILAKR